VRLGERERERGGMGVENAQGIKIRVKGLVPRPCSREEEEG